MALFKFKRSPALAEPRSRRGYLKERLQEQKELRLKGNRNGDRMILLVGEEGGVLVHLRKGRVVNRIFSPSTTAPEAEAMTEAMRKAPNATFYIVFDTVDQTYVQQTLPPVAAISVNKLIKRRLDRDFSDDYIKGAFVLGREKGNRKDWQFMMAALQQTSMVKSWLAITMRWHNPCRGIMLLPVESFDILSRLLHALKKQGKLSSDDDADWRILVSYNKVSGIRQVVFRNGQLVLTRLGQPALDSTSETIAGTIEQEIISTQEYLKRLSQGDNEKQHIVILAAGDICTSIDINKLQADRVDLFTPFQAAELLELEGAAQPSDRFGDSLLCAVLATSRKRQLMLSMPELRQQQMFTTALYGQRALAAALAVALVGSTLSSLWNMYSLSDQVQDLQQKQAAKEQEIEKLKKKTTHTPEELDRIVSAVDLYNTLGKETYRPDSLLLRLSQAFPPSDRLFEFSWQLHDSRSAVASPATVAARTAAKKPKNANAVTSESLLTIEFPDAIVNDRAKLQQETTDLLNQVKIKLPDFEVTYSALPALISNSERIDLNLSQQQSEAPKPADTKPLTQARMALTGPADSGGDGDK